MKKSFEKNVVYIEDRLFNDPKYDKQNEKILALGWKPKRSLINELPTIIKWYSGDKNFFKKYFK